MNATIRITWIASILLLYQACNERKQPLTREEEIISRLQHDKSQSEKYRKSAGVLLSVLQEKEGIKFRDYFAAKREVSSVRSEATAQAWIALLQVTEKRLPDTLPTSEEIDFQRKEDNRIKSKVASFDTLTRLGLINSCVSALSYLDMPEAKAEVESFLQRFEKKYGDTSGGKKMLDEFRIERRQKEEEVRKGLAPWQLDPNTGDGVS